MMKPYQTLTLFGLFPALLIIFGAWVAGVTTLHCKRVDGQVNCTIISTRWLGFVASAKEIIPAVRAAKTETYSCTETKTVNGKNQ